MIKDRVIEFRRVRAGDLVPHPDNWREHPTEQRQAYASILEDIGFAGAILTRLMDDGRLQIIDGHMRSDYSPDIELPCVVTDLTSDEADKALVSFDPLAMMARTNADKLEALHARIHTDHEGLRETLAQMAADAGIEVGGQDEPPEAPDAQIDRAGELQKEWQTELGQLWEIPSVTGNGVHRVLCGDSTNADDVSRLMGGVKADLLLTDPPYGINVVQTSENNFRAAVGGSKPVTIGSIRHQKDKPFGGVKAGTVSPRRVVGTVGANKLVDATLYRPVIGDDKPFDPTHLITLAENQILFGGNYFASRLTDSRCWIVWDKNNTGFFADAELAWTSFEKGVKLYQFTWNGLVREGDRKLEGVKRIHPTQKPVGLFMMILDDYSEPNQSILDTYLGSGTTLIAAEQTGRICYGMELEPAYIAVTLQRAKDMGLEPRLVIEHKAKV